MITHSWHSAWRALYPKKWFLVRIFTPALVALSIALPPYFHFRIERLSPELEYSEPLESEPTSAVLDEVSRMTLAISLGIPASKRTATAFDILAGRIAIPDFAQKAILLGGFPTDLTHGGPTLQLVLASLAVENLLLDAFEKDGNAAFYQAARERVLAFALWEAKQREPFAFLWNDHAIAARISVITRLWRHMRNDQQATSEQKTALIALIVRSAELLAKESQFTARTNHGVMQNVALLQVCAAFSTLPKIDLWRKLALDRLEMQLGYYVSDEGIVLEHSAEYHVFGVELLAYALRLAYLNGIAPPERLRQAFVKAEHFNKLLVRPDGSLPLLGNTAAGRPAYLPSISSDGSSPVELLSPPFAPPASGTHTFPVSGYSLWWSSAPEPSQIAITWSKHDRHGHKHADEGSIHFWSRGHDWLTATGYWPYGLNGFENANGWSGSNAPHEQYELSDSVRIARLLSYGDAFSTRAIDIEVDRESGTRTRRQVIQLEGEELLVLDFFDSDSANSETLWTLDSRMTMQQVSATHFISSPTQAGKQLQMVIRTKESEKARTELLRGRMSPFAGWVVVGRSPQPASAVRVLSPAQNKLTATLLSVTDGPSPISLDILEDSGADSWTVAVVSGSGQSIRIKRQGQHIQVSGSAWDERSIPLLKPQDISSRTEILRESMSEALKRYPPWRDLGFYRRRLYTAILALWLLTEIALALCSRLVKIRTPHQFVIIGGWIVLTIWAQLIYLT